MTYTRQDILDLVEELVDRAIELGVYRDFTENVGLAKDRLMYAIDSLVEDLTDTTSHKE